MTLVDRLRQFNAKERYWLVKQALGGFAPNRLFLEKITKAALLSPVPDASEVYLAMDYHLNWIHAALSGRELADSKPREWENPSNGQPKPRRAVEGNQEDVDLLLAYPRREEGKEITQLIFVEAKCGGSFTEVQLRSKFDRLALILAPQQAVKCPYLFDVRFVLMSPTGPDKDLVDKMIGAYQSILHRGLPWMRLEIDPPQEEGFWMARPESGSDQCWALSRRPRTRRNVPDPRS